VRAGANDFSVLLTMKGKACERRASAGGAFYPISTRIYFMGSYLKFLNLTIPSPIDTKPTRKLKKSLNTL